MIYYINIIALNDKEFKQVALIHYSDNVMYLWCPPKNLVIELAYIIDITNAYDCLDFLFFLITGNINFKLSYNIMGTYDYFNKL